MVKFWPISAFLCHVIWIRPTITAKWHHLSWKSGRISTMLSGISLFYGIRKKKTVLRNAKIEIRSIARRRKRDPSFFGVKPQDHWSLLCCCTHSRHRTIIGYQASSDRKERRETNKSFSMSEQWEKKNKLSPRKNVMKERKEEKRMRGKKRKPVWSKIRSPQTHTRFFFSFLVCMRRRPDSNRRCGRVVHRCWHF